MVAALLCLLGLAVNCVIIGPGGLLSRIAGKTIFDCFISVES